MNIGNLMIDENNLTVPQLKKANEELRAQIKKMYEHNALQKKAFRRQLKKFIELYEIIISVQILAEQ